MSLSLPASLRSFVSSRGVRVLIAVLLIGAIPCSARTRKASARKHPGLHVLTHAFVNVAMPGAGLLPDDEDEVPEDGQQYHLKLARAGEMLDVVYRVGDTYIPDAIEKLNTFLRDSHNEAVNDYDPRTFDVLHTMLAKVGRPDSVVDILSAYRTKETNDMLRESGGTNAALHSQHIEAKALDLRVPGVAANTLRDAALSLEAGGVGYYPKGGFVHVDVGPVRQWTYSPHAHRAALHKGKRSGHSRRTRG